MKRFSWLYILLMLVGCTESSIEDNSIIETGVEEFYATIEGTNARTYVDEQIRMRWHAEDRITIFKKETYNREFEFTGKTGANAGGFNQVSVDDEFFSSYKVDANYAVYPHSADTELDETDCFFTLNMPAEQTYAEKSFGLNANTMVAVSESGNLALKDRLALAQDGILIVSLGVSKKSGAITSGPEVIGKGCFINDEQGAVCIAELKKLIPAEIAKCRKQDATMSVKTAVTRTVRHYFKTKVKRNPVVLPVILET